MAISKEELLKKVSSIVDMALSEDEGEKAATGGSIDAIDNHIHLYSTVKKVRESDPANESLRDFCDGYLARMDGGCPDELLYESFISGATQWNYIEPVDTELSALSKRVRNYSQDIDILKILKTMRQTESYYIVPLVEDVVSDYVRKKNPNTRMMMVNRLMCYEYDPFIKDIIAVVDKDRSIENNCMYLGESIESAKSAARTSKIYSPVQFIRENECVFSVDGQYYIRKGNTLSRMSASDVRSLPESFRRMASLICDESTQVGDSCIKITDGSRIATIDGKSVTVDGDSFGKDAMANYIGAGLFEDAREKSMFENALALLEHYDDIACIDFCRRVSLKESNDRSVDLFRLKDNIFITQNDRSMGTSTFYRNCNPIQARKLINEHLMINAAPLFEDLLPNQVKMLKDISARLKEYSDYIKKLMDKKAKYEKVPEGADENEVAACNEAKLLIDGELNSVKDDYAKYKKQVRDLVDIPDDDVDSRDADADAIKNATGETNDVPYDGDGGKDGDAGDEIEKDDSDVKTVDGVPDGSDLRKPISDAGEDASDASDGEGDGVPDSIESISQYDGIYDDGAQQGGDGSTSINVGYEVIDINYSKNIKTGVTYNFGNVTIKVPSVNPDGNVTNDLKNIPFNLDKDRNPVLNNSYMPVDLYNGIVDAIKQCDDTKNVDLNQAPEDAGKASPTPFDDDGDFFGGRKEYRPDDGKDAEGGAGDSDGDGDEDDGDIEADFISQISSGAFNGGDDPRGQSAGDAGAGAEGDAGSRPSGDIRDASSKVYDSQRPIVLKRAFEAYRPISISNFKSDLNEMGISYMCSEGAEDGGSISISVANRADFRALREYFHKWKNWGIDEFEAFYPELKGYSAMFEMKDRHDRIVKCLDGRVDEDIHITVEDTNKKDDDDKGIIFDKTFSKADLDAGSSDDDNDVVTDSPDESMEGKRGSDSSEGGGDASEGQQPDAQQGVQQESVKKGIHFRFKASHKMGKTDEGFPEGMEYSISDALNEDYVPSVCDRIKYHGDNGQIVSVLSNGDYVLMMDNTSGGTETAKPSQVKMITLKKDSVKCPCKFDETTLKLISEQYVPCGYYINGIRVTPYDCKVKYSDYLAAKPDDDVRVVLEGNETAFDRRHLKVDELADSILNPANFDSAKDSDGRDIYYNVSESIRAGGTNAPVHVISKDDGGNPVMMVLTNDRIVR